MKKIKNKIVKGFSEVTDYFLNKPVYVRFPFIQLDLQSLRSYYSFHLVQMMKKEMQNTASSFRKDEVWEYLLDNYELEELLLLRNFKTKEFDIKNVRIVDYVRTQTKNTDLKNDLNLIARVNDCYNTIKDIEELLASIKNNVRPRTISPAGYIEDGHILYRPKYDLTKENIVKLNSKEEIKKFNIFYIYYNFFNRLFGNSIIPVQSKDNWTFIEGFTREVEGYYLKSILSNEIEATSEIGKAVQKAYMKEQKRKGQDFIYIETLDERINALDFKYKELTRDEMLEIRGINDFMIYYTKVYPEPHGRKPVHEVPIITGLYTYDYDNEVELHILNRILGITGEFSRINYSNSSYPTYVLNNEGVFEPMYRVEEYYDIAYEDLIVENIEKINSPYSMVQQLLLSDRLDTNEKDLRHFEQKKIETQADMYQMYVDIYLDALKEVR